MQMQGEVGVEGGGRAAGSQSTHANVIVVD